MKLSQQRTERLYSAFGEPITDLRIHCLHTLSLTDRTEIDDLLCKMETEIWRRVKAALNLEDEA